MLEPTHKLVQISDTHITSGEPLYGSVDSLERLEHALAVVADGIEGVDALLLTGDLANDGSPAAYRRLRSVLDPVAEMLDVPVVYLPGNHDERGAFRAELLGDGCGDDAPIDLVTELDGLRLVLVDSSRPGTDDGHLSAGQATWLVEVLAEPAEPAGTVLLIHHPPLPSIDAVPEKYGFRDRDLLASVVAGTDIRLIVSGHWHLPVSGTLAGIPVWAGASTALATDPLAPPGRRVVAGSGVSMIELYGDGSVVTQAVPTTEPVVLTPDY